MSYHSHPMLSPLAKDNWTHRIQAPLTYLQSSPCLHNHNLISVLRPRSTRYSSVVTLARPPSSSSLKITDRSFFHLVSGILDPVSLHQRHSGISSSISDSPLFLHRSLLPFLIKPLFISIIYAVCWIKLAISSAFERMLIYRIVLYRNW